MVDLLAIWLPERTFHLVADSAYIGAQTPPRLASERPGGWPDPPQSQSDVLPASTAEKAKNAERLPTPTEMMENPEFGGDWDDLVLALPTGKSKQLQVKVVKGLCWPSVLLQQGKIQLVLVLPTRRRSGGMSVC